MTKHVIIHCQPSIKDTVIKHNLSWSETLDQDVPEIDVMVEDIDSLEDEELCNHYNIDYHLVNCIEAYNFCAI